jgi:hypothetical protein
MGMVLVKFRNVVSNMQIIVIFQVSHALVIAAENIDFHEEMV